MDEKYQHILKNDQSILPDLQRRTKTQISFAIPNKDTDSVTISSVGSGFRGIRMAEREILHIISNLRSTQVFQNA